MRSPRRTRLSYVLAALAIALFAWCVFGHRGISWRRVTPGADLAIGMSPTLLYVARSVPATPPLAPTRSRHISTFPRHEWERVFASPSYMWRSPAGTARGGGPEAFNSELRVPVWMMAAALACIGAWLFISGKRRPRGLCPKCGYDLSGLRGKPCPECGTAPALRS